VNLRSARHSRSALGGVSAALVLVVALAAVAVGHHRAAGGIRLVSESDGSAAVTGEAPGVRKYYAAYFGNVCVSARGSATIRSIVPVHPHGGLRVTDFSVVKDDGQSLGNSPGRLRNERSYRGSSRVTLVCDRTDQANLFVEVYKPRAENAWAREYRINYESDGHFRTARLRFGFGVCEQSQDSCNIF